MRVPLFDGRISWVNQRLQHRQATVELRLDGIMSLLLGAAEAGIALPNYLHHQAEYLHPSTVIPGLGFFVVVTLASAIAVSIALIMLPAP